MTRRSIDRSTGTARPTSLLLLLQLLFLCLFFVRGNHNRSSPSRSSTRESQRKEVEYALHCMESILLRATSVTDRQRAESDVPWRPNKNNLYNVERKNDQQVTRISNGTTAASSIARGNNYKGTGAASASAAVSNGPNQHYNNNHKNCNYQTHCGRLECDSVETNRHVLSQNDPSC